MTTPSERLAALGVQLPPVAAPVAAYVPATRIGDQVWTSGQLPTRDGALVDTGLVGRDVSPEVAADLARTAALNALAAAADVAGGLDAIQRVVKVVVYVASDPAFVAQPAVANGASTLLRDVFGSGHVRSAVGVAALPLNAPVEVEIVVEV
ncbi:MAG TPA: RidA family protein [Propionibacteriaceae bacterium]|nr:RidA family protein [Propionibacteriaceae bacterium]